MGLCIRVVVMGLLLLVPLGWLSSTSWSGAVPVLYCGLLPALTAILTMPALVSFGAALVTSLGMLIGLVVAGSVWWGTAYLTVVAVGVGASALRGWTPVTSLVAVQVAIAVIAPPPVTFLSSSSGEEAALWVVPLLTLAGGLWAAVGGTCLLQELRRPPPAPAPRAVAQFYAVALGVLTGAVSWWALRFFPGTNAWWVLLTIFVVLVPRFEEARQLIRGRMVGTLVGAVVAVVIMAIQPGSALVRGFGLLAVLGTIASNLVGPVWLYSAFLTAVVLWMQYQSSDISTGALTRVSLTVVGGVLAGAALAVAGRWWTPLVAAERTDR